MKISVIISTYESVEWLAKVLCGYQRQGDPDFEIIVADDGSGPATRQCVEGAAARSRFAIRHLRHDHAGFGKWAIVNKAIVAAEGEYLLFTDGDCIPHRDVIATHRAFAAPGRFLSGGYYRLSMATSRAIGEAEIRSGEAFSTGWLNRHGLPLSPKTLKIVARPWRLDRLLNLATPAKSTFNGNNSSCFRADALRVRGFDQRIGHGGGDREFGYRLEHAGIRPKIIRYSALCLHLDHARGYADPEIRARNLAIIEETRRSRRIETAHGIAG